MLIRNRDEFLKLTIDGCDLDGVLFSLKASKYIDPEDRLDEDKLTFDPKREVSVSDYKYILSCLDRIEEVYKELANKSYISELPGSNVVINGILVNHLNMMKILAYLALESMYYNDVNLAKSVLDETSLKIIQNHTNNPRVVPDFFGWWNKEQELGCIKAKEDRFDLGEEEVVEVGNEVAEKLAKEGIKLEDIGNLCSPASYRNFFISHFDIFVEKAPSNPAVMKYRDRISKLPIRREELALIIHASEALCFFGICEGPKYSQDSFRYYLEDLSMTELLNLFWKKSDDIKKVIRTELAFFPTRLVDVFWSLLEVKEDEEKEEN